MAKVNVPMDFGIENLQCPVHNNIELLVTQSGILKANSLILSYNSAIFHDLFFKQLKNSVDVSSFSKNGVGLFIKCLYSGKCNVNCESFRELSELADKFSVVWLISKCEVFYIRLTDSISIRNIEDTNVFNLLKFTLDEASLAPKRSRVKYKSKVREKIFSMKQFQKSIFVQKYAAKYLYLSVEQLNAFLDIAQGYDGIILKIVQENMAGRCYHLDERSAHILKSIDFENCLVSDSDIECFKEFIGHKFFVKTQKESENLPIIQELVKMNSTKRLLKSNTSLLSEPKLALDDKSADISKTFDYDHKFDYLLNISSSSSSSLYSSISDAPMTQKNLICDFNIANDLHDPTCIPNLFSSIDSLKLTAVAKPEQFSWSSRNYRLFYVKDILKAASTLSVFKNLYMVIELILYHGYIERLSAESDLDSLLAKLIEVKSTRGWKRVHPCFLSNNRKISSIVRYVKLIKCGELPEYGQHEKFPLNSLLLLICNCKDLVSEKDYVELVCQRGKQQQQASRKHSVLPDTIRMGEFLSSNKHSQEKRIYKFYWSHPHIKSCPNPKQCGFIINVSPITEKSESFDIGLCTEVSDYPSDIHIHPEVITSQKMHFVLRIDYNKKSSKQSSENTFVSWAGKPINHSNHVHWGGQSIALNGYIALVVYYEIADVKENLKQDNMNIPWRDFLTARAVAREKEPSANSSQYSRVAEKWKKT